MIIENLFFIFKILILFLYVCLFLGIWKKTPYYLRYLDNIFKIFISLVLIYIFNPFQNHDITKYKSIVFTAGILLFIHTILYQYLTNFFFKKIFDNDNVLKIFKTNKDFQSNK